MGHTDKEEKVGERNPNDAQRKGRRESHSICIPSGCRGMQEAQAVPGESGRCCGHSLHSPAWRRLFSLC